MDDDALLALELRSSLPAPRCFFERAAHYRYLSGSLRRKTRFFAAAAWINGLLGVLSSCGRLSNPTVTFLSSLGARLLIENNGLARRIDAGLLSMPPEVLDRQLVEREQYLVEEIVGSQEKSDPYLRQDVCKGIDALLNTAWLRMGAALLPAPLCAISRLASRQPLTFASKADRETIGHYIVRCME